jgi:hypothetical protein
VENEGDPQVLTKGSVPHSAHTFSNEVGGTMVQEIPKDARGLVQ